MSRIVAARKTKWMRIANSSFERRFESGTVWAGIERLEHRLPSQRREMIDAPDDIDPSYLFEPIPVDLTFRRRTLRELEFARNAFVRNATPQATYVDSFESARDCTEKEPVNELPEVVLMGRSNCGKSTLLNALLGTDEAMVSKSPGRTKAPNLFQLSNHLTIVSLHFIVFSSLISPTFSRLTCLDMDMLLQSVNIDSYGVTWSMH